MIGDRWIFARMVDARTAGFPGAQAGVYTPSNNDAEVLAEVSSQAMTTRQANGFQRALANRLGYPIGSYRTRARTNPTLVHHGLARGAHFHLMGGDSRPVADLYITQGALARDVAQLVADQLGISVIVKRNIVSGAGSIHTHLATVPARGRARRNPAGAPRVGEVWTTARGGRCKIVGTGGGRVTVLHLETGNRETIDLPEFLASYRAPRRANPVPRSIAKGSVRSVARGRVLVGCPVGKYHPRARGRKKCAAPMRAFETRNPRAPFEAGERVSVPYTGRSSYFGRKVKRTRERATVQGYGADGTVHVSVKRGRGIESHHFPESAVRRLPKRGAGPARSRVQGVKRRLELKSIRQRHKDAIAAAEKARRDRECAEAQAKAIQPQAGEAPLPEYNRQLARLRKLTAEIEAQEAIAAELERQDPRWRDPWALPQPARNARGARIVHNKLLGGWYVVVGPHQTPLNGRFDSKADAQAWLAGRRSNPKGRKIGIGPRVPTVRADTLKVGDIVMPPDRELRLWMIRDAAERGMTASDLGIMLTDVHDGAPDKRGRWIILKGYLRDDWYQGRRKYPFTFKARPDTPWPLVATPTPNRRRKASRKGPKQNPRAEGARARRTFKKWHEFDAHRVTKVKGPSRVIPKTLVKLGELRQIVYDSDKYAGGPDNPRGETITYEHTTKRPRPLLVTDPDGRSVHIVGGRMQVTADGLRN